MTQWSRFHLPERGASLVTQMVKKPMQEIGFDPLVGKIPWRRKGRPTPGFLPGKSHGQRSLVGYSPWSHKIRHNLATEQQQWGIQQNEEEPLLQLMWAVSHLCPGRQESQTPGLGPLNFVTCWTVGDFLSRSPLCSIPVFTWLPSQEEYIFKNSHFPHQVFYIACELKY